MGGSFLRFRSQYLQELPIRHINFDNPIDKKKHNDLAILVDRIMELNKRLAPIRNTYYHEHDQLLKQIERTDKEIDNLVYDLHGLSDEERKIIEGEE